MLTHAQARACYDRIGRLQDTQGFYEDAALDELVAVSELTAAHRVFELGCGTGRLAHRLLTRHLPGDAEYRGIDLSPVMVGLARERLAPFGARARVEQSDGEMRFPLGDGSVDRVVSSYVLDLLPEHDIARALAEAHRVLEPGGLVCLVGLTEGVNLPSRTVAGVWRFVHRLSPALVGGCRPVRLEPFLDAKPWAIEHRSVVTPFGVPSEILVARSRRAA